MKGNDGIKIHVIKYRKDTLEFCRSETIWNTAHTRLRVHHSPFQQTNNGNMEIKLKLNER